MRSCLGRWNQDPNVTNVLGAIELPAITVGGLGGITSGTTWLLDNGSIDHYSGYHQIIGKIGVTIE